MQTVLPLEPGHYYHIYNRGVNGENLFREERNYAYFLRLYTRHIMPVADTFAYCLLRNHFHLSVRIKTASVSKTGAVSTQADSASVQTDAVLKTASVLTAPDVSRAFNNFFTAYAKAINKAYERTGALFQHHFGRRLVTTDRYFVALIHYLHHNPQKHGFVTDFREWPHSSYHTLLSDQPTRLNRAEVLTWFGGVEALQHAHTVPADEALLHELINEDI